MLTIQDLMRARHLTSEDKPAKFSAGSQEAILLTSNTAKGVG